jgi:hypothetical protein
VVTWSVEMWFPRNRNAVFGPRIGLNVLDDKGGGRSEPRGTSKPLNTGNVWPCSPGALVSYSVAGAPSTFTQTLRPGTELMTAMMSVKCA